VSKQESVSAPFICLRKLLHVGKGLIVSWIYINIKDQIFECITFNPRFFNNLPMKLPMPLPIEETTPPVTKMYFCHLIELLFNEIGVSNTNKTKPPIR